MKKRHNSAPWAPDEASPYLNESSRCAESESEEHFVRKAHFSAHFSVKKCYFPVKNKSQNWVEIKFQRNIWGQLDVRTRMRASKSWNFDLEKPIKPIKMDSCVIFADHCRYLYSGRLSINGEGYPAFAWRRIFFRRNNKHFLLDD